jgi:phospholipid/cholesterol/gamma-HCH transport system ATP-binding protein
MVALVEVRNITNQFGGQVVHKNLSLTLEQNEVLGIAGGSGSGKSVLLRTILGLNPPKSGKVLINGTNIYGLTPEQRLDVQKSFGVLFQNGALFSGLTVLDNVALPMREHTDLSPYTIDKLAFLKLRMVGLDEEAADKFPAALSGGMETRAAVARAMALDPGMLFLDEPTGALDPVAASSLDELMISLRKVLKLSIVVITHDLATLAAVCDRIALIADKKVEVGTFEELVKSDNKAVRQYFETPRVKMVLTNRQKETSHGKGR